MLELMHTYAAIESDSNQSITICLTEGVIHKVIDSCYSYNRDYMAS